MSKVAAAHGKESDEFRQSREGAVETLEHGTDPLMHASSLESAMDEGSYENISSGNVRIQQHAKVNASLGEQGSHANIGSGNVHVQQHAMVNASLGTNSRRQDVDMQIPVLACPQSICVSASAQLQGTVLFHDSMLLDDGSVAGSISNGLEAKDSISSRHEENMQSTTVPCPQGICGNDQSQVQRQSANVSIGGIPSSHGGSVDECNKATSSSLDNNSNVCMDSGDEKFPTMHGNCSNIIGMQGVCNNASSKQPTYSASPNVWKKHSVVPLPSMKDLGNPPSLNGADDVEVKGYMDRFRSSLVGRLFGRHFSCLHLNNELHRRWDVFGSFKLLTLSNDCFICFFDDVAARDAVLMAGPWILAGQVIGLDVWTPSFSPSTMHGFITPIWIRFLGLPLYCWGRNNITGIAFILGEPIWIDNATAEMSRAPGFALKLTCLNL